MNKNVFEQCEKVRFASIRPVTFVIKNYCEKMQVVKMNVTNFCTFNVIWCKYSSIVLREKKSEFKKF